MDDDFNTAAALGVLFEAVKTVNTYLKETQTLEESFLELAAEFFRKIDSVLGVLGLDAAAGEEDAEEIEALIAERNAARKNKDFKRSDAIRDDLAARGILLEDTPDGTKWKKKA